MNALSYAFFPTMPQAEIAIFECSDRIVVPKAVAESHALSDNDLLMISNVRGQAVYGTLITDCP